jgi:hypothetical protein
MDRYPTHECWQWTRVAAAMALIKMQHVPAMEPIATMLGRKTGLREDPITGCIDLLRSACDWIGKSEFAEIKASVAEICQVSGR